MFLISNSSSMLSKCSFFIELFLFHECSTLSLWCYRDLFVSNYHFFLLSTSSQLFPYSCFIDAITYFISQKILQLRFFKKLSSDSWIRPLFSESLFSMSALHLKASQCSALNTWDLVVCKYLRMTHKTLVGRPVRVDWACQLVGFTQSLCWNVTF